MKAPTLHAQWKKASLLTLMSAVALSLAACGGGSSSGVSGPAGSTSTTPGPAGATTSANAVPSSVSGTVAYGHPVAGGYVVAIDVNGNKCGSATTASDGTYSMSTTCAPGPVEFAVLSGAPNNIPLVTLAIPANANAPVSGTVNITPLTTMIVYDFLGTQTVLSGVNSPNSFSQVVGFIPTLETTAYQLNGSVSAFSAIAAAYQNAANQVLSALAQSLSNYGASVAAGFNPVTTAFTANGQGVDAFFDANPETVSGSNNLQLGAGSNPVLSIAFSGSPSASATLGGSAAGNATNTPIPTASQPAIGNSACTSGTYCYAYLGKSINISELVTSGTSTFSVNCTGQISATPISGTTPLGNTTQVAMIDGTCNASGSQYQLTGEVMSTPLGQSPAIITYVGLPNNLGSATWGAGDNPPAFTYSPNQGSIGVIYGTLTIE